MSSSHPHPSPPSHTLHCSLILQAFSNKNTSKKPLKISLAQASQETSWVPKYYPCHLPYPRACCSHSRHQGRVGEKACRCTQEGHRVELKSIPWQLKCLQHRTRGDPMHEEEEVEPTEEVQAEPMEEEDDAPYLDLEGDREM